MPRCLNENDIEQMLDMPNDGSEDGFESDEAEEFDVNTIQRLLEAITFFAIFLSCSTCMKKIFMPQEQ